VIERILKNGKKEIFEKTVTRDVITVPSLTTELLTGKNNKQIAHITISIIGEETEHLMQAAIASIKKAPLAGIIIDLRGNG
jgi:C-terminal processing protease CtpA/Prc